MHRRLLERRVSGSGEQGGVRPKFIVVVLAVVIFVVIVGDAGCLYVPFAYKAHYFKNQMQGAVDMAATKGYSDAWVTEQLTQSKREYDVPPDAIITTSQAENRVIARVQFTQRIPFPAYWTQVKEGEKEGEWYIRTFSGHFTYNFEFDYTVKSATFFSIR